MTKPWNIDQVRQDYKKYQAIMEAKGSLSTLTWLEYLKEYIQHDFVKEEIARLEGKSQDSGKPVPSLQEMEAHMTKMSSGVKFDDNKRRDDLFPVDAFQSISEVLTFGAKKYADRNWEKGMKWGRLYRAALGHLMEWWKGNDLDPETNLPHLAHAATCVIFLLSYHLRIDPKDPVRNEWDNRP